MTLQVAGKWLGAQRQEGVLCGSFGKRWEACLNGFDIAQLHPVIALSSNTMQYNAIYTYDINIYIFNSFTYINIYIYMYMIYI